MASFSYVYFFILCCHFKINMAEESSLTNLEEKFLSKFSGCTSYITKWLEKFNDNHLGNSSIGRLIHYEDLKPAFLEVTARGGRNMKKMGGALIPLIFHVGATSTWILLTGLLAAKSVAIGLALLVFKIAVSSAKVASFFTALKASHHSQHHEYSWTPHSEHHGYDRSLSNIVPYHPDWSSYSPQANEILPPSYKTIPYHHDSIEVEYTEKPSKTHS